MLLNLWSVSKLSSRRVWVHVWEYVCVCRCVGVWVCGAVSEGCMGNRRLWPVTGPGIQRVDSAVISTTLAPLVTHPPPHTQPHTLTHTLHTHPPHTLTHPQHILSHLLTAAPDTSHNTHPTHHSGHPSHTIRGLVSDSDDQVYSFLLNSLSVCL